MARPIPLRSTTTDLSEPYTSYGANPANLRVLFVTDRVDAPYRYRAMHACMQLREDGICADIAYLGQQTPLLVPDYSVVVLFRLPWSSEVEAVVLAARAASSTVVFDIDDLIFDPKIIRNLPFWDSVPWRDRGQYVDLSNRLSRTFEEADFFTGATEQLVREAMSRGKPAAVHPNLLHPRTLSQGRLIRRIRPALMKRPIISYMSGSATHDMDFLRIAPILSRVLGRHPEGRLLVCGFVNLEPVFSAGDPRVIRLPYLDWQILPWVQSMAWINLAPIATLDHFTHSKSALKFFEAAAVGVPTAASPIDSIRASIQHGKTGFLCESSGDWESAIEHCLDRSRSLAVGAEASRAGAAEHSFKSRRGALRSILADLVQPGWHPPAQSKRIVTPVAPEQVDPKLDGSPGQRMRQRFNRIRSVVGTVRKFRKPERLGIAAHVHRIRPEQRTYVDVESIDALRHIRRYDVPPVVLERLGETGAWHIAWQVSVPLDGKSTFGSLGADPTMVSPPVEIPAADYPFVLVRLACCCGQGASTAQFYWLSGSTRAYCEETSICFPVLADGELHDYLVDLRRDPHGSSTCMSSWMRAGTVTRLRFDPMQHPGEFQIAQISFLGSEVVSDADNWARLGLPTRADEFARRYLFGEGIAAGPKHLRPQLPACAVFTESPSKGQHYDFCLFTSDAEDEPGEVLMCDAVSSLTSGGLVIAVQEDLVTSPPLFSDEDFSLLEDETQRSGETIRRTRVWRKN